MYKQLKRFAAREAASPTPPPRTKIWANPGINTGSLGASQRIHGSFSEMKTLGICCVEAIGTVRSLPSGLPTAHTTEQMSKWSQGWLPKEVPNTLQNSHDAVLINYNPYGGYHIESNRSHKQVENNGQVRAQVIRHSTSAEAATQEHQASRNARPALPAPLILCKGAGRPDFM